MTTSGRRRALIVGTALACLLAADASVRLSKTTLRQYDSNPYERTVHNLQHRGMADIVLMGSSRARCGLVPGEFETATGKTVFSAAISGSMVVEWQLLARQLFSIQQPQLVVLGINAHELRADYVPTKAARYQFDLPDLFEHLRRDHPSMGVVGNYLRRRLGPTWALFDSRFEIKARLQEEMSPILPAHAQIARELRERVSVLLPSTQEFSEHASWAKGLPTLAEQMDMGLPTEVTFRRPKFSPDADPMARLKLLLDWFNDRGIAVLVVYIPNSPVTEERWRDVEPAMIGVLVELCRARGVPFLGCDPGDVPRTNADFLNEFHAAPALARRISGRAARHITAVGLLGGAGQKLAGIDGFATEAP